LNNFNYARNDSPRQQTLFEQMMVAEYTDPALALSPGLKTVNLEPQEPEEIGEQLPELMASLLIYNDFAKRPACIIPPNRLVMSMAAHQTQRLKSSKRARPDADVVWLLGRVFMAACLNESPQRLFHHWLSSLGKGHRGIVWEAPPHGVGLRTTTTASGTYRLPDVRTNRYSSVGPTIQALVHVERQHSGATACRFDGWAFTHDLNRLAQLRGDSRTVSLKALETEEALGDLNGLKRALGGAF